MSNKKQSGDFGLGEALVPVIDLMSEILLKLSQLMATGLVLGMDKYVFKRNNKNTIKKIERDDLKNDRRTLLDEAIGYSVTSKRNIMGSEINKSAHTAVVGASGSGKTVLLDALMFEDMRQGKPVVFIDPKGDNGSLLNFINLCKLTGRDFYVFSEYWNGEGASALNPVKDGSSTNIADRIFKSFTWSEEHYAQICRNAIEDAVSILKSKDELVNLESIYNKLIEISDSKNKEESLYKRDDIQGILSRLKKITRSDFGEKLNKANGLSFKEIRDSKKCVYIGLPVLGFAEISRAIGKIILGDVSYSAYKTYRHITPLTEDSLPKLALYIDELSAVITDEFIEILNKVRGAKMEITFAFQSPSDIAKYDKELCTQVLENTSNWFVFKQRIEDGAKIFSEAIGTMESKKQTIRVQDGEEQAQGSQRVVEELISHPNILKNLNVGQCILLRHYPTKIDLLNVKYIDPKILWDNVKFINKEVVIKKEQKPNSINSKASSIRKRRPLLMERQ
ncbi:TraM recognition domain-containing protein [Halobacteriovorax sp. YZS-1-2]|uniref:TraM recognition domain-containing protein n=1 Tax=Halobacteriovorax sp. YZS-1-2 TaxID=3391177 RepID=UPI0039996928